MILKPGKEAMKGPRTDKGVKKIARWTLEKIWKFSSKDAGRYNPGIYNFLQVLSTLKSGREKKNVCVCANMYIHRIYTERYGKICKHMITSEGFSVCSIFQQPHFLNVSIFIRLMYLRNTCFRKGEILIACLKTS